MIRRYSSLAVFVFTLVLLFPLMAWPCAVCLSGAVGDDPVADAFNWSVLFLMATPYTIVGSIGGWLAYAHWRDAAEKRGAKLKRKIPALRLAWIDKENGR